MVGSDRKMLRFLFWRMLGLLAVLLSFALLVWLLGGGPGRVLRTGGGAPSHLSFDSLAGGLASDLSAIWRWAPADCPPVGETVLALVGGATTVIGCIRWRARRGRRYVRLRIDVYRTDHAGPDAVAMMFEALHKRLLRRWWRRVLVGQPSVALEIHHASAGATPEQGGVWAGPPCGWLAVSCPHGLESMVQAALQSAYPNCRLSPTPCQPGPPPVVLRLKKHAEFIKRVKVLERFEREGDAAIDRLLTTMGACGAPTFVQLALTPTPAFFDGFSKRLYKRHEAALSRARKEHLRVLDRSMVEDAELRGGLDVQHRPLFFLELRVIGPSREVCERIASELRVASAENRLVERGTAIRHGLLGLYDRRVQRGEGNPIPSFHKGVFATSELAGLWHLPSSGYMTVPFARTGVPLAPAPPGILRPTAGTGTLRDALGPVSIHADMRKQNVAVPGTVEQGKSSYLVATVAEDLRRERCAVIVLDPKGDAAEAAVSLVPERRVCTLLDFAHPTCGFNPLAVDAPADVIADYAVAALRNLFTDSDIRASSDRYLRNAIIAVLAHNPGSSLWDAARLLSVGEEGYAYRRRVGARVRTLPEFKEIAEFFTAELVAQLADSRSTTTAKLDAPVNKLARLLNSPSIKRVLLNESLPVDFDRVIAGGEVLVVKGALGAMGAGNTSVLMQLLVGMLDAALARQQDLLPERERVAVALKIDEAPLVLNRGFAETMALKRSAGLETVACWQTDSQWVDREVREQLDALFAHRVYFATASARDARSAVELTMAEFSDTVRPGVERLSALGHPDVRLHLPKHHAIVSWSTQAGRQPPFIAQTIPLRTDHHRLAVHATRQRERGGRHLDDLRQPHWDRQAEGDTAVPTTSPASTAPTRPSPLPSPSPPPLPPVPPPTAMDPAGWSLPATPAESYRELVDLDHTHSARWGKRAVTPRTLEPDHLDLDVLVLVASLRHVLTSQIHRRFNRARSVTTTHRRLKRLADAGLLERFQFHRRDGGGVPMCCVITAAGLDALEAAGRGWLGEGWDRGSGARPRAAPSRSADEGRLRQARHDAHVAGWVLALAAVLDDTGTAVLRGPEASVLSPPGRSTGEQGAALAPVDLRLPGGRTPHDFLRTDGAGERIEVERFETLRPDAIVEGGALDVLVELDDRAHLVGKLERYDHFLAGWSVHTRRYGPRSPTEATVVFVCRDRARARERARDADGVLCSCRAYAGEYPFDWEYPARERILFVAERDVHEGLACAYGVPRLPPAVRVAAADGDPRAGERTFQARAIAGRLSDKRPSPTGGRPLARGCCD
jgi:Replication-relaxation